MRIILFFVLFGASILYSFYKGGAPERSVAAIYVCIAATDPLVHMVTPLEFSEMDPGHFIVDLVAWTGFLIISLRAKRFWPLWLVSLQTIALVAHTAKLMDVSIHPQAYYTMQVASSYPALIVLAIGAYFHQRRLKANGTDPSWRSN